MRTIDYAYRPAERWRRVRILAALGIAISLGGTFGSVSGSAGLLMPTAVWIPQEYHTGGAYTAIQAGPDGTVYLGTTFYGGFARFLAMGLGAREFTLIADMASATGETAPGPYAQAKIHTKPVIAPDGRVYFATKSGKPANDPRWQADYPGGHLLAYDPRTRRVTDFGIPRPRQSIIALGVDRGRGLIYLLMDPEGHLITFDPATRAFTDRGKLAFSRQPTRYLPVLGNGDVYHPAGADAFMRYDAAGGRMERVPLRSTGQGVYDRSPINDGPYAMAVSLDGQRFYGIGETSGQVYTFTPGSSALTVQYHGSATLETAQRSHYYTVTTAPDGNAYYTVTLHGGPADGTMYILRLLTKSGKPEIVGRVGVPPLPPGVRMKGLMVQGSTPGPDGTLYIMLAYPLRVLVFPRLGAP